MKPSTMLGRPRPRLSRTSTLKATAAAPSSAFRPARKYRNPSVMPKSASAPATPVDQAFRVEVVVRDSGLEITNGSALIASLPKVDDQYDLEQLSTLLMSLKRDYPDKDDASVLLEPDIRYDYLIQVMDVVRSAELPAEGDAEPVRVALFTDISVGDAP